jgi:dihydrofolate synthase / folylpolyglutamate synthase
LDESFSVRRRLLVFATTREKDVRGMLERLLGRFDHVIFTRYLENPRGVPPQKLQALARAVSSEVAATPAEAWGTIQRLAKSDDLVCITGSFFIAAEMRRQITARPLCSDARD